LQVFFSPPTRFLVMLLRCSPFVDSVAFCPEFPSVSVLAPPGGSSSIAQCRIVWNTTKDFDPDNTQGIVIAVPISR